MVRRGVVLFLMLYLFFAAVQYPIVLTALMGKTWRGPSQVNVIGPEATAYTWPAPTPHQRAWPELRQYTRDAGWGRTKYMIWALEDPATNQTSHSMQHEEYGWPLPVLTRTQRWWPFENPAWKLDQEQDTGFLVSWLGTLANPAIVAAGATALYFVPIFLRWNRNKRRRRRGLCENCAYPIGASEVCTECGEAVLR